MRAVCDMAMLVSTPVRMSVSRPKPLSMVSSRVSWNALMRIFSTMKSPSAGAVAGDGSAPQVPRSRLPEDATASNRPAFTLKPGEPGSTMNQTWKTGMSSSLQRPAMRLMLASRF